MLSLNPIWLLVDDVQQNNILLQKERFVQYIIGIFPTSLFDDKICLSMGIGIDESLQF